MASSPYLAFFDESERLIAGDPLCVAGYTFKRTAYRRFSRAWRRLLDTALPRRPIRAMHMTDLIQGKKEFERVQIADRVTCLERAATIICEHAMVVTGALVDQKEFESVAGSDWPERFGGSYAMLCQRAAQTTATWLREKKRLQPIAYTFEAGHIWQHQTNEMFNGIGRTSFLRQLYQYGGHSFASKASCHGAQAADIAAWISVRIRVGDAASARSIQPFLPTMIRLVNHFDLKNEAVVRFLRGPTLLDFINEQRNRPTTEDIPCEVGPAKRTFR